MEKRVLDEELKRYIAEDWKFRVKRVVRSGKEYRYIFRKKGNEDKSLGRFDEHHWNRIQELIKEQKESKKTKDYWRAFWVARNEKVKELQEKLLNLRTTEMCNLCRHSVNRYCHRWPYGEGADIFPILDELRMRADPQPYMKVQNQEGKEIWVVRASPEYCAHCPAYEKRN